MPKKIKIPIGKICAVLSIGNVYAFKPEKITAKARSLIYMKLIRTSKSMKMKARGPQVVFFIKGTNYSKTPNVKLTLIKGYGEIKIHAVKVFPTRIIPNILYADRDNNERIYLGVGLFRDELEQREFIGLYVRGEHHLESPSYFRRKPKEWRTWCEFHVPYDSLTYLKRMLQCPLENKEKYITVKELEDLILCIEFPQEKIVHLIKRINHILEEGIKMPAASYLIPIEETTLLEYGLNILGIPVTRPLQRKSCSEILSELRKKVAKYATPEERQIAYLKEREKRHGIAQIFEEPIIEDIINRLRRKESALLCSYEPFGIEKVKQKIMSIDEAEKGRPDFKLVLKLYDKEWVKFIEIKIKSQPYVKERAWYFDEYVYKQLLSFAEKYKVSLEDIVIVFAYNPSLEEDYKLREFQSAHWYYCIISLEKIRRGIKERRYKLYQEGYGALV